MTEDNLRIDVRNLSKKFNLDIEIADSALSKLIFFLSGKTTTKTIEALRDISFQAKAGEIIGLIGKNGAGKSTLLRILAEVYGPDQGEVKINGKVLYLGGLGQGLMPKLTMRENIYLIGTMLGLSYQGIKKRFDEIIAFVGFDEFVDAKVYQFSSGMKTRLTFAVTYYCAKELHSDILLLDEVFGTVGDLEFQDKALTKIEELISSSNATILIISHQVSLLEQYCHRVMWLDKGKIVQIGDPKEVLASYTNSVPVKHKIKL